MLIEGIDRGSVYVGNSMDTMNKESVPALLPLVSPFQSGFDECRHSRSTTPFYLRLPLNKTDFDRFDRSNYVFFDSNRYSVY